MNDDDMEKLEFFVDEYYVPEVITKLNVILQKKY